MSTAKVHTSSTDGVMVVTIDRPERRNAIDEETAHLLAAAMDRLDDDDTVHVGVITGAGGTFCAGMDLKAFLAGERPSLPGRGFAGLTERPPAKPLIAAVEGYALAGGFEIVLACDLVVAGETARFGLPEVRRGLAAGGGGLIRLPEKVPVNVAMEWALTGNHVSARQAQEAGLVNRLVPDQRALEQAVTLAGEIQANGPLAVRASKAVMRDARFWEASERFDRQRELTEPVRGSADAREGARAFVEKRAPQWQSR